MEIISKGEDIVYSTEISNFLSFLKHATRTNSAARDDWKDCDNLTQDILHTLELSNANAAQKSKLASLLTKTRKRRRVDKNIVDITNPISNWYKQNKSAVKSLEDLLGTVRKIEKEVNSMHTYIYKTDEVKSIICKECEVNEDQSGEG